MRTRLLAAFLPCLAAAACDEPGAPTTTPATLLRVINAADGPVDVLVDGQTLLRGLAAGAVSPRLGVSATQHAVQLREAGTSTPSSALAVTVAEGRTATVYARSTGGALDAEALLDTALVPGPGKSKLRVIHLAANAPAVDVWRTQPDYQTFIRIQFPFPYEAAPVVASTPGTWEVRVTLAGESSELVSPVLTSSGPIAVGEGELRTVVLLDVANGGVKLELLDDR